MKAAILKTFGSPLTVETLPDPILGTGEVIVDVVVTGILPYVKEVFSGERKYLLSLPVAPGLGEIGRVRAVGPDATRLEVGDWVLCDPTVRSRDNALISDITLQGWSARGEGAVTVDSDGQSIESTGGSLTYAAVGSVMSWQAEAGSHLLVFHFPSGLDRALANGRGQDALVAAWLESTGTRFLSALPLPEDTAII